MEDAPVNWFCRLASFALVSMALASPALGQAPVYLGSWPCSVRPLGLASSSAGQVFVGGEYGSPHEVEVFTQLGAHTGSMGSAGNEIYGLAQFSNGDLLVARYIGHAVSRYAPSGGFVSNVTIPGSNCLYLAIDSNDDFYVTDDGADRVRKFSSGGGALLDWHVQHPSGVAVVGDLVYVAEMFTGTVRSFTTSGVAVSSFSTGFTWAEQLTDDGQGNLLLTDHGTHRLNCFRPDGTVVWSIGPSIPGYSFDCDIFSVCRANNNELLVGDYANRRVLRFGFVATPTRAVSGAHSKRRQADVGWLCGKREPVVSPPREAD